MQCDMHLSIARCYQWLTLYFELFMTLKCTRRMPRCQASTSAVPVADCHHLFFHGIIPITTTGQSREEGDPAFGERDKKESEAVWHLKFSLRHSSCDLCPWASSPPVQNRGSGTQGFVYPSQTFGFFLHWIFTLQVFESFKWGRRKRHLAVVRAWVAYCILLTT